MSALIKTDHKMETMDTKSQVMDQIKEMTRKPYERLAFNKKRTDRTLNERFLEINGNKDQTIESNGGNQIQSVEQLNDNKENMEPIEEISEKRRSGRFDDNILRQLAQNFKQRRNQNLMEEKKIFRSNVGHNRGLDVSFRPTHRFRSKPRVPTKLELDIDIDLYMSGAVEDLKEMSESK